MATIINQREVLLQATAPRMIAVSKNFITVTAPTNTFSTTATGTSPNSITVRASLSGELSGTVAWTTSPSVAAVVDGNIITIAASLVPPGTSVTITATLTAYGQTYTNSAVISKTAETVVSSLSSTGVSVSTAADGSGGNYASATSTMSVAIGTANNSSAWTYSWSVPAGVTATGANTSTISVSAMAVDTAALTCTATRTGWPAQTKTFTVSKSKAGATGAIGTVTRIAYQLVGQTAGTPAYTASTVGSATLPGAGWSSTVPTATVGNVIWYIYGQYNPNAFISQGIAAYTTLWSAPIAASIFQDIRSDNWNGSNPPTATTSTWGTNGYYINRTNGIMVANSFYARGKMQVEGNNTDLLGTALKANSTGAADIGVYGYSGGGGTTGRGVVGLGNTASSVGVVGTASGATASSGVLAFAIDGATTALTIQGGTFKTDNSTLVTNLNADLLDGKHVSALVQVASGTTNANYLYYLNNNTTPSNQTTRAAWIKISTNDGSVFWVEGYL